MFTLLYRIICHLKLLILPSLISSKKGKEATQTNVLSKPSKPSIPSRIDSTDLSHAEKELKSEQEKNKGNEVG